MSGLDIAGVVLGSITIVQVAVVAFQEARPGRTASSLRRKLNNESTIYEQFLNRLLEPYIPSADIKKYLKNPEEHPLNLDNEDLAEKMRGRLGDQTFDLVVESLKEMESLLKTLGSDLKNMSAGMKMLEKITNRVRVHAATRPMSSVQRNLAQITEINKELRRLVSGSGSMSRPRSNLRRQLAKSKFLHREYREPSEVYKTICGVFPCDCDKPHIANIGCQCPSCHYPLRQDSASTNHKWMIELVLVPTYGAHTDGSVGSDIAVGSPDSSISPMSATEPPGHEMQRSLSVRLDEPPASMRDSPTEPIADLCSVITTDATILNSMGSLGIMGRAKQYDLQLIGHDTDGSHEGDIVTLSDLISINSPGLTRRQRMQIAFQLCVSVLQLYRTPWVDDAWSWEDSCALRLAEEQPMNDADDEDDEAKREFPHLFITHKFYSRAQRDGPQCRPCRRDSAFSILARDPILAKLGFALIVLAVNKTLSEIRQEKGFKDMELQSSEDVNDFMTARRLLRTSRIRDEAGSGYEDAVRACIDGEYTDVQAFTTTRFQNPDAEKFYDVAEKAIMHPLFTYCQAFD